VEDDMEEGFMYTEIEIREVLKKPTDFVLYDFGISCQVAIVSHTAYKEFFENFPHNIDKNVEDNQLFAPYTREAFEISPTDEVWKKKRGLSHPCLNLSMSDNFVKIFDDCCKENVCNLKVDEEVDFKELSDKITLQAISEVLFRGSLHDLEAEYIFEDGETK
jgi:cytochrome P450